MFRDTSEKKKKKHVALQFKYPVFKKPWSYKIFYAMQVCQSAKYRHINPQGDINFDKWSLSMVIQSCNP